MASFPSIHRGQRLGRRHGSSSSNIGDQPDSRRPSNDFNLHFCLLPASPSRWAWYAQRRSAEHSTLESVTFLTAPVEVVTPENPAGRGLDGSRLDWGQTQSSSNWALEQLVTMAPSVEAELEDRYTPGAEGTNQGLAWDAINITPAGSERSQNHSVGSASAGAIVASQCSPRLPAPPTQPEHTKPHERCSTAPHASRRRRATPKAWPLIRTPG